MLILAMAALLLYAVSLIRAAAQLGVARLCNLPVDRASIGLGPALWKRVSATTGTTFQLTWLPFGAFVRLGDEGPASWRRLATVTAALATAYLAVSLAAFGLYAIHGVDNGPRWVGVREVVTGSDAAAGKLEPGDRILAVDGDPLSPDRGPGLAERVNARAGAPLTLTIHRAGALRDVSVTPRRSDQGAWRLGIQLELQIDRDRNLGTAAVTALRYPAAQMLLFIRGMAEIVVGREQADLAGPVRMVEEFDRALASSWAIAFQLAVSLVAYLTMLLIAFDLIRLTLPARLRRRPAATR